MKKLVIILSIVFIIIGCILCKTYIFNNDKDKTSKTEKNTKVNYSDALADENIKIKNDLKIEYGTIRYISDFIETNNIELKDEEIIYTDLGDLKVNFEYKINNKTEYRYLIFDIVDTKEPLVSVPSYKTVELNSDDTFINNFFCADNYDKKVERHIEGFYDLGTVGTYNVKYVATDSSSNKVEKDLTINVVEKINNNSLSNSNNKINYIDYNNLYNEYKTDNTKVGIDISRWQGDVDFEALKNSNVEFIMIRLGGQDGLDGEYYIDSKFTQNIKGALEHGFDVGVYFYSYAYTKKEAINQAKYVIENLKDYKITLPIVFDWECWNKFNELGISLFDLTKVQDSFLDYVEQKGYKGSRYGSKNYLTNAWQDSKHLTWLAHYISSTTYEGEYFMWQRCDTGKVNGINGAVDVDILYLDKYNL